VTQRKQIYRSLKLFRKINTCLKRGLVVKTLDNKKTDNFKSIKPAVICLQNLKKLKVGKNFLEQQKFVDLLGR
jgi:hypothetical protein